MNRTLAQGKRVGPIGTGTASKCGVKAFLHFSSGVRRIILLGAMLHTRFRTAILLCSLPAFSFADDHDNRSPEIAGIVDARVV